MNLKNKRGINFLATETTKIVIATLCIVVLVGFVGKIYYNSQQNEDLEQAEATLNRLVEEINDMQKNGETEREFEIWNPANNYNRIIQQWYLISSVNNYDIAQCSNLNWNNCVCICNAGREFLGDSSFDNIVKECNNKGKCIEIKNTHVYQNKLKLINPPINIEISLNNEGYILKRK